MNLRAYCFALFLLQLCCLAAAQDLLLNGGFENGVANWKAEGFTMRADFSTVHAGLASAFCTGRTQTWHGPAQDITLTPGGRYQFNAYVSLVDDFQGKGDQPVNVQITVTYVNGSTTTVKLTSRLRVSAASGWVHLGSFFQFPTGQIRSATLFLDGPAPDISFYFDEASLVELPEYTTWLTEANESIEQIRKSNINFRFTVPASLSARDIVVHIDHTKHLFGFGSRVRGDLSIHDDYKTYQNITAHLFNWATIEEYRWAFDAGDPNTPNYARAVAVTDQLTKKGLKIHGHYLFSSNAGSEPAWVGALNGQSLKDAVDARIKYLSNLTKGKVAHWVVNNELLHARFYEDATGDPDFTQKIFSNWSTADPNAILFLNDYNVVASGDRTFEYADQIAAFKAANVGLKAAGIQSHLDDFKEPDVTLLRARLGVLARPKVPLWITALSIPAYSEFDRADWYEKVLRLFFSHPSIEGINLWGWWDHDIEPLRALVHGETFSLAEAGRRFLRLTKQEWSTHVVKNLVPSTSFTVRGFQGDYTVVAYYKGQPFQRQTFSLGKTDLNITINIKADTTEISLPNAGDPFALQDIDFSTSSLNLQTLGYAKSTSQSQQLTCVSRWSADSSIGDDKTASIGCNAGEVLTGCSSYLRDNSWHRDGEEVTFINGQPSCTAFNGFYSTIGIRAQVRCCSLRDLQCRYRSAGPSGTGERDEVIVPCSGAEYPLGCGTWTFEEESLGSIFTSTFCVGQNDDPKVGVYAFASCCESTSLPLHCITMYSTFSGQNPGDRATFTCPTELAMTITGCNSYAPNGRTAGAFIETINGVDTCVAVNGFPRFETENGVQAVGTCCRIQP